MTNLSKLTLSAAAFLLGACTEGAEARPHRDIPAAEAAAIPLAPVEAGVAAHSAGDSSVTVRYEVAGTGNVARYRVREQLVGRDLPNDAVGETGRVSGAIAFDESGAVVPGESRFVVGTDAFKSDSDRRDGYVRRRLLEAEQFPTVELVPTALAGLPANILSGTVAGPVTFTLTGQLTVRGVTRPTTWTVTARTSGNQVTGTAATTFTFEEFTLTQPRVAVVLSVADTIGLEYDFTLVRRDAPAR
jgi:polyisoprenoid-binding protein YceI